MAQYSIGEFSKITGLSIDTLRYYEKEQLVFSHRLDNNRRYYEEADIEWVNFILRLKETGMSIKNMKEYARLRYQGDSTIDQRMKLLTSQLDLLHDEQDKIDRHLTFLENKIQIYQKMKQDLS